MWKLTVLIGFALVFPSLWGWLTYRLMLLWPADRRRKAPWTRPEVTQPVERYPDYQI